MSESGSHSVKPHVLVTGASSPLGRAVARVLRTRNCFITGTVRTMSGIPLTSEFDELIVLDLLDPNFARSLGGGFHSIIHVAAASTGSPRHLMQVTGTATETLAQFAIAIGAQRFVHVSSISVYGTVTKEEVTPLTPIKHSSPYGAAKWAAECYLQELQELLPSRSIRSCAIVGKVSHRNFLAQTLLAMRNNEPTIQLSNPEFLFNNVVHEETLAKFLVHLALNSWSGFLAAPVASTDAIPLSEVISLMARRTDYRGKIQWIPARTPPFSISIDAASELGYEPMSTHDSIQKWLREDFVS